MDTKIYFEGIDGMNRTFYGPENEWKPIMNDLNSLVKFKGMVCDNIVQYKKKK